MGICCLLLMRFHLVVEDLVLRKTSPSCFLIFLPDEDMIMRVYNGGRPFNTASWRLHLMHWSCFLHASGSGLPLVVDVELQALTWDKATAEELLNEYCWVQELHHETAARRDAFRLIALFSLPSSTSMNPCALATAHSHLMNLQIIEPHVAMDVCPRCVPVLPNCSWSLIHQ
jgi:hypothetical protein